MRFHQLALAALPGPFYFAALICLSKQTHGNEDIIDWSATDDANDDAYKNHHTELNHELLTLDFENNKMYVTSRSLQDDDACSETCDSNEISNLAESIVSENAKVASIEKEEDEDNNGLLRSITSVFGRWMTGLFRLFNRRQDDDPQYPVPTATIVPLLSTYSDKIKSLAKLIRDESANDAALSTTPDAIRMMYNISANNMESVAAVLDPILENMRQHKTMDIRTISCQMTDFLILLRDDTVPNIKSMTQLIYTKSNIAAMKQKFQQEYTPVSTGESFSITATDNTCLSDSTIATTRSACRVDLGSRFTFLFNNNADVGPIGHILAIVLLIILFPLSIVVSIIGVVVLTLFLFAKVLLPSPGNTDDSFYSYALFFLFVAAIKSPINIIRRIQYNIKEFFADILDPFIPDRPTPAPIIYTPYPTYPYTPTFYNPAYTPVTPINSPMTAPAPVNALVNPPMTLPAPVDAPITPPSYGRGRDLQQINEVAYHLKKLLKSPILTILQVLQNGNRFADANRGEGEEQLDCQMAAVKCDTDALMDVLPL